MQKLQQEVKINNSPTKYDFFRTLLWVYTIAWKHSLMLKYYVTENKLWILPIDAASTKSKIIPVSTIF